MNISELHNQSNELSTKVLFNGNFNTVTAIQLKAKGTLKEHKTKTPALLLCIKGKTIYEDESNNKVELVSGDYYNIIPNVKHWLLAIELSELILIK